MPFQQRKLERSVLQTRGIFNKYVYAPDNGDTLADISAADYFSESRFIQTDGDGWSRGIIEVNAVDGYIVAQIDGTGLSANAAGGAPFQFGNNEVNAGTSDRWLDPGIHLSGGAGQNESYAQVRVQRDGFLGPLQIQHYVPGGNGNDIVYTIRVNGSDSSSSVTLASTASVGSDTLRVPVSDGDLVSVGVTKAATIAASPIGVLASVPFI